MIGSSRRRTVRGAHAAADASIMIRLISEFAFSTLSQRFDFSKHPDLVSRVLFHETIAMAGLFHNSVFLGGLILMP